MEKKEKKFAVGKKVRYWNPKRNKQIVGKIETAVGSNNTALLIFNKKQGYNVRRGDDVELLD